MTKARVLESLPKKKNKKNFEYWNANSYIKQHVGGGHLFLTKDDE